MKYQKTNNVHVKRTLLMKKRNGTHQTTESLILMADLRNSTVFAREQRKREHPAEKSIIRV